MAGVKFFPDTLHVVISPTQQIRIAAPLLRLRKTLPSACSRASCFWSQAGTIRCSQVQLYSRERWKYQAQRDSLFSTSAAIRTRPEDAGKQHTRTPQEKEGEKVGLRSNMSLTILHAYIFPISFFLHVLPKIVIYSTARFILGLKVETYLSVHFSSQHLHAL